MMERFDRHRELVVFVQIAESGGFGKAAAALGISTSQASRALARLEDRLGTQLMTRTTRHVALTEAGRALFERSRRLLAELDETEASLRDQGGEPRGLLRVSLPTVFGMRYVSGWLSAFAAQHPALELEMHFDDRRVDLVEEGYDLAVRIARLDDSSLIARKLGTTRGLTLASPEYLARKGVPEHPRDLATHDGLHYLQQGAHLPWKFSGPDGDVAVRVTGRIASNSGDALRVAAIAGAGVTRAPDFLAGDDVVAGRLVRILVPWEGELPISAVYPPGRHLSPKVRQVVDFLVDQSARAPWQQCQGRVKAADQGTRVTRSSTETSGTTSAAE